MFGIFLYVFFSIPNIITNIKSHVGEIFLLRYRTNRFIIRAICYVTRGKQEHKKSEENAGRNMMEKNVGNLYG